VFSLGLSPSLAIHTPALFSLRAIILFVSSVVFVSESIALPDGGAVFGVTFGVRLLLHYFSPN